MKKSITHILSLFCLLLSLQSYAQDYDFVARKIFNEVYNETNTSFLKTTIENLGKQDLIYTYAEHFKELEQLAKERDNKLENIVDNFKDQYKNPDYYSDCKYYKTYNQKNESTYKRAEKACAYTNTTLSMYNICKNNTYRTTNCSSQLNNHNRQVNLCNDLSNEQKQYNKKAVSYKERCNSYINRYLRASKNVESNYRITENSYNTIIRNIENTIKRHFDELVSLLSNALYPYKEYYSSGNLKKEGNTVFGTGEATGEWKYYYETGQLESIGNYLNGNQTGEWKQFYKNGQLEFLDNYKNGKQNGIGKSYHENGDLKTSGNYLNSKKTGEWKVYIDGKLSIVNFLEGEQIGELKYYDKDGNLIIEETELEKNTRLAQEGNTLAQYKLGRMFMLGKEVARNGEKAFYWAEIAAKKGDKDAQFLLGFLYFHGTSDKNFGNSNWNKAKIWLTKAKEQGHTGTQTLLDQIGDD